MNEFDLVLWIALLPLLSFLAVGFLGGKIKPLFSGIFATAILFIITVFSYVTAYQYFFNTEKINGAYQQIVVFQYKWLPFTKSLFIELGAFLDPISAMMLVVITTVSLMAHFYSIGYMKGEEGYSRFFSFLSLFTFSMLSLVLANNIFQLYIFWELVGVSSYLLIGFYYDKPSAVEASKKAFVVTRFADLGFLVGILILSFYADTFDFPLLIERLTNPESQYFLATTSIAFLGMSVITWSLVLIFIGGAGKSAMFPLHIWLPDAMEGPTPVSALIHAATMVVAGVYLVARLFPIFAISSPIALEVVAYVGGISALFAAIIACTQTDIKRVLAYSTMSQIGYMMLALGVAGYGGDRGMGYSASMFHLFTHAMFKALLFLGAGAIIHAVHNNFLTGMGGLRKYLPITHITFLIACLAISGIPPFAGFFSKDLILAAAYETHTFLFILAFAVAGITSFYMFRLYFSIFWGVERNYEIQPHESPLTMTIPLILLALASISVGFIPFNNFVTSDGKIIELHFHASIAFPAVIVALIGILTAFSLYRKESNKPQEIADKLGYLYKTIFNKFYIDELYLFITKKIIFNCISRPVLWFEENIVEVAVNGTADGTQTISTKIRNFQSGQLQQYAFFFLLGVIVFSLISIYFFSN
ncbi:NADH-quinone oxidoreductase subunit L [Bacteroidales bacterium AH-315-N07]|nr:NADH-quinone oxidoreductase subunit L [Bacteroidales bacterium AH-315-N07]